LEVVVVEEEEEVVEEEEVEERAEEEVEVAVAGHTVDNCPTLKHPISLHFILIFNLVQLKLSLCLI
jgi:hypothetical protein